ncbi:hypothetical protein [Luteimonas suaedae]|uniref:hypothetical protein n=1 Tax=Luteimonas suaedae TaxID=2605430 RepID=UPI0011EDC9D1|nr:hypothetical protein [Luteimonas suaedae]
MNAKFVMALALACGLAGCRDPGPGTENVPVGNAAQEVETPGEASTQRGELPAAKSLGRPLPGGISNLSFPYHVNIDRDTGKSRGGRPVREIGIELLGATPAEAEAELSRLIGQQGGSVQQRQEPEEALRVVYALSDGTRMLAWFRPGPPPGERYELQRTDATGTLYMAWPYLDKSAQ